MPRLNLFIDCTNGVSGDRLSQCLKDLCDDKTFVEAQMQLVSDELLHEKQHAHHNHTHDEIGKEEHAHSHTYTHRSFQSILTMLSGCELDANVKAMTLKIYTILAIAEADVHGETLETVHFHEVGRPQAIINMVGVSAAFWSLNPDTVYCSSVIDGTGTVQCAHGEIPIPVPAVRAMMDKSNLDYGRSDAKMEMVTPTGLAALLAMEPKRTNVLPEGSAILKTATSRGNHWESGDKVQRGLKITLYRLTE